MNVKTLIIAFLAPRYPAAYSEAAIAQRINASKMSDRPVSGDDVYYSLVELHRMKMVDLQVDSVDNTAVWQIAPEGQRRWHLEGRITLV